MESNRPIDLKYREGNFCRMTFSRSEALAVADMLKRAADNEGESREFGNLNFPDWTVTDDEDHAPKTGRAS